MNQIVFTGGGTAGHIFPGLAIINELKPLLDARYSWIGSSRGMDRAIVEGNGVHFYGVPTGKLRRYASLENFIDLFRTVSGIVVSFCILVRLRPRFVFSKGGFASVPSCIAARILGIPVFTHECDYSPGLATRINARFALAIFTSFNETSSFFPERMRNRIVCTGNPVRPSFYTASTDRARAFLSLVQPHRPVLLVLGGSLGARQINELIGISLSELTQSCLVIHQTGLSGDSETSFLQPVSDSSGYISFSFIRAEMPDVLSLADIVLARSGSNTVWECAAVGKPMVLIPLEKGGSRGDQVENAAFFQKEGAAIVLRGKDATREQLVKTVSDLLTDHERRTRMANAAARLGSGRPAHVIAQHLCAYAEHSRVPSDSVLP